MTNITKRIDIVYLVKLFMVKKGQLCMSSFKELVSYFSLLDFVMFFFYIYRVIYLIDLSARFITTKITKLIIFVRKLNILLFRNNLAGSVNLVKLAWMSWSQYLLENNFFAFYIQHGQLLVRRFFQMIILAVLSENTVQCPKK